jgi:hypothetical protein
MYPEWARSRLLSIIIRPLLVPSLRDIQIAEYTHRELVGHPCDVIADGPGFALRLRHLPIVRRELADIRQIVII